MLEEEEETNNAIRKRERERRKKNKEKTRKSRRCLGDLQKGQEAQEMCAVRGRWGNLTRKCTHTQTHIHI